MVLNFPTLLSPLFPTTAATGEGFDADFTQKVVVEAGSGIVPIGGIVAWDKTLAGVPQALLLFVECNGQVLDDPDSPLDGQTIPNLNAGFFIKGAATSGSTGGSTTHSHTLGSRWHTATDLGTARGSDALTSGLSSTYPDYYEVVWIMRVK